MTDLNAPAERDSALVERLLRGDKAASSHFFSRVRDTIWTVCRMGTHDEASARRAYEFVCRDLQAESFARLRPFRGDLDIFIRLVVRESLVTHILALPDHASDRSWLSFEALFKRQIMSRIATFSRDPARQAEIYQRVCIILSKDDYRILRSYCAAGKLGFSLRKIVRSAAADQQREEDRRTALPEAVARLSKLDMLVFRAVYWEGLPENPDFLLSVIPAKVKRPGEIKITREGIEASIARVRIAARGYERPKMLSLSTEMFSDGASDPGAAAREYGIGDGLDRSTSIENDDPPNAAIEAMREAIDALPERERLFARVYLEGSHERRRNQFGDDNYKLIRKVKIQLARQLADVPAIKEWLEDIRS